MLYLVTDPRRNKLSNIYYSRIMKHKLDDLILVNLDDNAQLSLRKGGFHSLTLKLSSM